MKYAQVIKKHQRILLIHGGLLLLAVLLYLLAQQGIGIPCLFRSVTGLLCPGCGNSRAALALLRLDIPAAMAYNPMFPVEFLYLLWVYLLCWHSYRKGTGFTYRPPVKAVDITLLAVILLWGVLRNLL